MDGRISLAFFTCALTLGCAGCVTTQTQQTSDIGAGKNGETPTITKNDGPKRLPQTSTIIAIGKLKEADADSESAKSSPEMQARLRDDARKAYQKALEIDKNNLEAARCLAALYVKINDYERAFDIYKKELAKHPKDATLWYDVALAHQRRKELAESVRCLTKALELAPENRDYLKKLGFTLAWMGQTEQGLTYLTRAQGKAQAHCNIARILIERDQPQLARQHVALARQESPDLPEANALLAWLDGGPRAAATPLIDLSPQVRYSEPVGYPQVRSTSPAGLVYNNFMIRPTTPADTDTLVALTDATGLFKPIEIVALREVLADYHATNHAHGHIAITLEEADGILGFAYYGPAAMTDGTWQLWWIAVAKGQQGRGGGGQLLRHVENDLRTKHQARVLFIETGSLPHYELTRRFYRKHGYEQHALLQDFYADGDSMVVFRKRLS